MTCTCTWKIKRVVLRSHATTSDERFREPFSKAALSPEKFAEHHWLFDVSDNSGIIYKLPISYTKLFLHKL